MIKKFLITSLFLFSISIVTVPTDIHFPGEVGNGGGSQCLYNMAPGEVGNGGPYILITSEITSPGTD